MKIKAMKLGWTFICLFLVACGPELPEPVRSVSDDIPESIDKASTGAAPDADEIQSFDNEEIIVAILLPLSGHEADIGNALLKATTMALFDAYDPRLTIVPIDTKADMDVTREAAQQAVDIGASIVLGPLLSGNVSVAGAILREADIPLIGFSNDSKVAAPGRFIIGFVPELEVKRVVDYAVNSGLLAHAALVPDGRYGERVREAFAEAISAAGATVAAIESYPPDAEAVFEPVKRLSNYDARRKDRRDEIRFLRSLRDDLTDEIADEIEKSEVLEAVSYDAVLLPEGGELLKSLAPLLPFYELDPNKIKLLGTGLWNDESLLREPPLQGAYFAAPDPKAPNEFIQRYERMFEFKPPRIATIAYDAMSLVAHLAKQKPQVDKNGVLLSRFSNENLMNIEGFSGIDGLFRFLPDGTAERPLAILEIHRRGFRVIDAAPDTFPSFGYALRQATSRE